MKSDAKKHISFLLTGFFVLIAGFSGEKIRAEIRFKEVTGIMNKECTGPSWGGAWGDFNNDGYADLWLSSHSFGRPLLFLNEKGVCFREVGEQVLRGRLNGDRHGAMWADFDNDGDQDLIQLTGGGRGLSGGYFPSLIYVNKGGFLEERSKELGLSNPKARCRDPFWLDIDNDGLLDLIQAAYPRPDGTAGSSAWKQESPGVFKEITEGPGIPQLITYLQLLCLEPHLRNPLRLLCFGTPKCILDPYMKPFSLYYIKEQDGIKRPAFYGIWDSVAADFDGDLIPEIFVVQGKRGIAVQQEGDNLLKAKLKAPSGKDNINGIEIETGGSIEVTLQFFPFSFQSIYIGRSGSHPPAKEFLLSPDDIQTHGIPEKLSPPGLGVFIGWDDALKKWRLLLPKCGPTGKGIGVYCLIKSHKAIRSWKVVGFQNNQPAPDPLLLKFQKQMNDKVLFNSQPIFLGNDFVYSSVIAGDFDNDMDVDLYVVASRIVVNSPNILLENTGNGAFQCVPRAGGAEGSRSGVGECVMAADFDNDGFLDFVLTNGSGLPILCEKGPVQLYRNSGNTNHWIEFDLQGTGSNRDGIGAQLWLTTPDKKIQYRLAAGGKHNRAQDFSRIHFGLGKNRSVNKLVIRWPGGVEQVVANLAANRIYRIVEKAPDT